MAVKVSAGAIVVVCGSRVGVPGEDLRVPIVLIVALSGFGEQRPDASAALPGRTIAA